MPQISIELNQNYFKSDRLKLIKEKGYFSSAENLVKWATINFSNFCVTSLVTINSIININYVTIGANIFLGVTNLLNLFLKFYNDIIDYKEFGFQLSLLGLSTGFILYMSGLPVITYLDINALALLGNLVATSINLITVVKDMILPVITNLFYFLLGPFLSHEYQEKNFFDLNNDADLINLFLNKVFRKKIYEYNDVERTNILNHLNLTCNRISNKIYNYSNSFLGTIIYSEQICSLNTMLKNFKNGSLSSYKEYLLEQDGKKGLNIHKLKEARENIESYNNLDNKKEISKYFLNFSNLVNNMATVFLRDEMFKVIDQEIELLEQKHKDITDEIEFYY